MSTYVMSDLHGCKDEFDAMLRKIQFSDYDTLWIDGDVCDRGRYSIPLLMEIMSHDNMHLVFGNHDVWLARYCQQLIDGKKDPNAMDLTNDFLCWLHYNGGYATADQYMDLSFPQCYDIKLYLEDHVLYQYVNVHGKKFLLVHAGLTPEYMHSDIRMSEVPSQILIWSHVDIDCNPYPDCTMIVGHVPTFMYAPRYDGRIIHARDNKTIHIDCGCVYGRRLGCIRLDDMHEFYIDSTYPYIKYYPDNYEELVKDS